MMPMVNARVGAALNTRWSIEGTFDTWPESNGAMVIYRAQARWLFRGVADAGRLQPHLTFGTAGAITYESDPEYRWRDGSGATHVEPARSYWNGIAPIFPAVGIGFQKQLGAHVALRTDLSAIIVPADDFVGVLLMPSVSLSFPIGRYPVRAR